MMKKSFVFSAVAALGLVAMSAPAQAFDTTACMGCHTVDVAKVGPSFKTVVKAYGNEKNLAKAFKSGFAVKDRKVANADPKWKAKAVVMSVQYKVKIKGHEKEAAHAVFETVKHKVAGDY